MDAAQNTKVEVFCEAIEDLMLAVRNPTNPEQLINARQELREAAAEFLKPHLRLAS